MASFKNLSWAVAKMIFIFPLISFNFFASITPFKSLYMQISSTAISAECVSTYSSNSSGAEKIWISASGLTALKVFSNNILAGFSSSTATITISNPFFLYHTSIIFQMHPQFQKNLSQTQNFYQ